MNNCVRMSLEKFYLKWNDFQSNVSESFKELRDDLDFCDVTLASDDNQQIKAHKVILAASSPLFMEMLRKNKHNHPLIYMRGIKAKDLTAMVDFIYHGEVNIYQDDLEHFLSLAEELQLRGLRENMEEGNPQEIKYINPVSKKINETLITEKQLSKHIIDNFYFESNELKDPLPYKTEKSKTFVKTDQDYLPVNIENAEIDDLNKNLNSMVEKINGIWTCKMCGKTNNINNKKDLRRHAETHIEGVSHPCNICGKSCRSGNNLRVHIQRNHAQ